MPHGSTALMLRDAARIEVYADGAARLLKAGLRDAYRDLCFLNLPGYRAAPMPMIDVGETEPAARAFQRVLMLDSTHAEAEWGLQQLEFELGHSLVERDRL